MTTATAEPVTELSPLEEARERAETTGTRLAELRTKQAAAEARISAIDTRLAAIDTEEHDARLGAARGVFGDHKRSRLLADLADEAETLRRERDELTKNVPALGTVIGEAEIEDAEARDELGRLQARPLLDEQESLLRQAGDEFGALMATWSKIRENLRALEAARAALPPELRGELRGVLDPPPADGRSFVHAMLRWAGEPQPIGAHVLPPLRPYIDLADSLTDGERYRDLQEPFLWRP